MRIVAASLFALGMSLLAPSEAAPNWDRVVPTKGHVQFPAIQRDETGKEIVNRVGVKSAPNVFALEFGMGLGRRELKRGEKKEGEKTGPEILVSADLSAGLPVTRYGLLVEADGKYTEIASEPQGDDVRGAWKEGVEAKSMVKTAFKDEETHTQLYKFAAVQRLLSPKGLMRQVMMAVFDPEGYTHYKTTKETFNGQTVTKRVYEIDVPNDSEKNYHDAHIAKLYTTWESVLGNSSPLANTARQLADFRTPVKSAHIVTYENAKGQLWLHSIALYRDKTPWDARRLAEAMIEFESDA